MTPIKTYQVTYQFGGNAAELQNVLTDLEKKATSVSKIFQALPQNLQVKTGKNSAVDSVIEAYNKLAQGQSKVLESQAGLVSNWKKQLQEMEVATKTAVNSINDILGSVSIPAGAFKGLETLANLKAGGSAKSKGAQKMLPAALGNYGSIKDFEDDFERTRKQAVKAIRDIRTLTPLFDKYNAASKQLEEIEKKGDKADKQWRPRGATAEERNALGRQRASLLASKLATSKALIAASDAAGGGLATTKAFDALKKSYEENLKPAYKDLKKQSKQILAARQHDKSASSANEDPFNINVNVDTAAAKTALEKLAADFKTLSKEFIIKPTIQIDANAATAKLKEAKAEILVKPIIDQEALAVVQGSLKEVAVPIKPTKQSVRNKAAKEAVADAKLNLSDQAKQLQQYATKHPVKIKTVYEAKGLTAKLNQTIKSLQTAAKGKSITITTNFSADGIVAALDAALIKAQELAQSKALTVKTNLLSESNGTAVNTSIDKLQKNVNSKPINIKTRLTGGGENDEALSLSIGRLQKLANERAILLRTKLAGTGEVREALSLALGRLQELANTKPIIIKTQLDTALTSEQLNSLLATTAKTAATAKPNSVAAGSSSDKEAKESKAPKNPWAMSKSDYNSYMREEEKMRQQQKERAQAKQQAYQSTQKYLEEAFKPTIGGINPRTGKRVAWDAKLGAYTTEAGELENVRRENAWLSGMRNPSGQNWNLMRLDMEQRAQIEAAKRASSIANRYDSWASSIYSPMGANQAQLLKSGMMARNDAFVARRQAAHQQWLDRDASPESPRVKRQAERKEAARQSRLSLHNEQELNRVRALKLAEEERALVEAKEATKIAKANNRLTGSAALRRQQLIASARTNGSGRDGTIANIRRNAYPWTGNTSFGARTPVALDMAKGMGMMFAVSGLMSTVTESFHQVTEYDNLMKTVRAILQTTDKGPNFNGRFENMENTVRDVGRKTKFTAPEVAGAARFMAMAGLNIENINAATEPIANLALIGDTELSETADKMTNIMTSFGLLKGLSAGQQKKNMIHTSDVLTNTFTRSNTDMLQLAEAMQYAGPMSHLFGTSLEDAAAMVGVMGNAGIQASMAGTSLRMMYQNIVKPNAKQSKEWNRLGIARTDKNGNIRPIFEILKDLRAKLTGTKDLNAKIGPDTLKSLGTGVLSLFRTTAGSGVAALLENLGEAEAIANTNRSANGVAAKIADEKKNTIAGLWAQVTSTFTDQNLTVATDFQNTIKQILTDLRDWLSSTEAAETLRSVYDLVNSILNVFKEVAKLWIGMYRIWPGFFKTLIAVQFAISQVGALMSPFIGLLSVIGSVKNTIMGLAGAFGTLNTAAGISSFGANGVGNLGKATAGGVAASSVASKAANVASSAKAFGLGSGFIGYMGASAAVLAPNKAAHPNYLGEYTRRKEFYKARAWKNGQIVDLHAFFQSQRYDAAIETAAVMSARRAEAHRMYLERRADPKKFVETHKKADGSSYGIGAYHTNMQRRANARQANRILSNATLLRATQMGKINAAQSAGLAFRNGMAAANAVSFVPLLTNVKNSLLSVVNAVSRGLGMLISPIGLVATALVGMAYLWSHFYNKQKELIKKDEELAKRGESGRNITKQAIMGNLGVVGSLNPSQTLTAPRHSVSRARTGRTILGSRFDPLLRNSREYRGAFDAAALNSPDYYDTYMKRFADTAGALYGKRGVKMNGWQILTSEAHYQRKHNKNGAAPMIGSLEGNKALRRDALNRLTAFNLGSASSEFASKKRIVQRWINSYDQLPESKKTPAAQQKLYHNISAMASSLREEAAERPTVIGRNISNMRATQVAQSREAYEGMAQQIEAMKDYVNGFNTSLQQLAGMMTFQAQNIHGQIVNFNLPFNKGALDWKALEMQFKMLGVKFQSNLNGHWSMMLQVFNTIQNNAELAQKYAGMSAGQLAALFDPIKGGYKFNPQEWKGWVSDWYNDNNWGGKKKYKNAQDFFNRGGWRTDTSLNAIRNHAFDKMTGGAKIKGNSNGVGGSSSSLNSGTTAGGGAHNATDQSKYDSKYKNNRSRPTQIIFKIGNLCNFNNTKVNNPGDLSAVEGVGKQLSIGLQELFAQAVSEYAIIGESQG